MLQCFPITLLYATDGWAEHMQKIFYNIHKCQKTFFNKRNSIRTKKVQSTQTTWKYTNK